MFPHPRPDVRALDASRIHAPVRGGDSPCFYTFTLFYTSSVGEKSKNRWNSNVFIAFFFYTFTLFLISNGKSLLESLRNRWNHWDFSRFPSLWKSRVPLLGMVIL